MKRLVFAVALALQYGQPLTAQRENAVTQRDVALLGALAAATVGLFPLDKQIAGRLQDANVQENRALRHAATGFNWIASPGALYIGGGMWLTGRLARSATLADIGWHGTESILLAEALGNALKGAGGRARPYVTGAQDPDDWRLGRGFSKSEYRSFPSGHTFTAFAVASSVTLEVHRRNRKLVWIVAPILYGGATAVGASRMYVNKHWASDVALGAAIGSLAGLKVVRWHHSRSGDWLDRLMLGGRGD